jgi:hypothetical protein
MRSTALLKSAHAHGLGAAPGGEQRRLVGQVGEVRAGEARA